MSCVWLRLYRRSLLSVATSHTPKTTIALSTVAAATSSSPAAPPPPLHSPTTSCSSDIPWHHLTSPSIYSHLPTFISPRTPSSSRHILPYPHRCLKSRRFPRHSSGLWSSDIAPRNINNSSAISPRSITSLAALSLRPRGRQSHTLQMDMNGDAGAKRKRSSIAAPAERPAKHLRPETSTLTPGDSTPANGTVYDVEEEEDAGRVLPLGAAQADSPEWQATIEEVVKSVVSIHFCQTCSFDTELSMSSQATGFVVDAERGYILTNRHVVCPGPFWGYCIFDNHEEVSWLSPINPSAGASSPFFYAALTRSV